MLEHLRKYRSLSVVPLTVWLLLQLAMTGIFLPTAASAAEDPVKLLLSNKAILCTPAGLKYVSFSEDGAIPEDTADLEVSCPWCLHFSNATPLLATDWELSPLHSAVQDTLQGKTDLGNLQKTNPSPFFGRAPPSINNQS